MTDEIIVGLDNASYHATSGKCETACPTYVPVMYLGSAFLTLFFCFLAQPASMLALNRSVTLQGVFRQFGNLARHKTEFSGTQCLNSGNLLILLVIQ